MKLRLHDATLALALALSWVAAPASAQEEPASEASEADRARALQLFQESADRYREGRFSEAAELLREARRLHSEPVLSYNLARALESAGDLEGAVSAYREYLEEAPDAADAPATRARLAGLERHLAEIRAMEEERERLRQEQERARRTRPPPRGPDAAPWIITGTGAGVVLAGGILGGVAVARNGDAQRAPTHAAAAAAADDAGTLATAANVAFVVGGIAVLAGAVWGTVDLVTLPASGGASASIEVGPGSIAVRGTF